PSYSPTALAGSRCPPRNRRRRLVEDRPEQPEALDGLDEVGEGDWLDYVGVHVQPVTLDDVALLTGGSEDYNRQRRQAGVGANTAENLEPVDLGHLDVEKNHGRQTTGSTLETASAVEVIECLGSIGHVYDLVGEPVLRQGRESQLHVAGAVLSQQDSLQAFHRSSSGGRRGQGSRLPHAHAWCVRTDLPAAG